ncbi:MAG: CPBP family intramembrane metalloprotease [Verrucomicrobiales bacterium]|jgi:membrane protease YdiL (CAAX protease family)|nr:CPBP family intramembrane metalloprotease [Verrucomicrobiales bacterium]
MRRVIQGIILYLLAIVILSAVLTPVACWSVSAAGWDFPARRVFNRSLMVSALLLLWPLVKFLRIEGWRRCGVTVSGVSMARILFWFAAGVGTIALLYAGQAAAGVAEWSPRLAWWQPLTFMLTAVIVSVLEETMFRGVLFCAWIADNKWRALTVMIIGSAFFATAHFIKAQNPADAVTWLTGWEIWAGMGGRFLIWRSLVMNWLTLFWTGMTLCAVTWRYKNIWLPAALHAGWVFALKTAGRLVVTEENAGSLWFAGNALEGLWPALLLAVMCALTLTVGKKEAG